MRKITRTITYQADSFEPMSKVVIRTEDGVDTIDTSYAVSKYSPAEELAILEVNAILTATGRPTMTEEEIEYFIDPFGAKKMDKEMEDPENLQKLAGFRVEKRVIYDHATGEPE